MSQVELKRKTYIDPSGAEALLFPIAAFLYAGGWTKRSAAHSFSRAFDRLVAKRGARQLKHIGNPVPYADIVSLWIRDPKFIDKFGRARVLHFAGRNGFTALVRKACGKVDPQDALSVLTHFRNVRRTHDGRYKLISPFFLTCSEKSMAFEPMACFLSDASETLGSILKRKSQSPGSDVFWRKAENANLSNSAARKFLVFGKERTLAFAHEMDEWLQAHQRRPFKTRRRAARRVGIGVFSICSGLERPRSRKSIGNRK